MAKRSRTRFDYTRRNLILAAVGGMLVLIIVVGGLAGIVPTPDVSGSPGRSPTVRPRNIDIWMVYPNNEMRFVTLFYPAPDEFEVGTMQVVSAAGPLFAEGDDLLSDVVLGGERIGADFDNPEENSDMLYGLYSIDYEVTRTLSPYGVDIRTADSPYITDLVVGNGRVAQFFAGPQERFAEVVVAIALPEDAQITARFNPDVAFVQLDPYKEITAQGWQILYYDTTTLAQRHLLRLEYIPGTQIPEDLDPFLVDRRR